MCKPSPLSQCPDFSSNNKLSFPLDKFTNFVDTCANNPASPSFFNPEGDPLGRRDSGRVDSCIQDRKFDSVNINIDKCGHEVTISHVTPSLISNNSNLINDKTMAEGNFSTSQPAIDAAFCGGDNASSMVIDNENEMKRPAPPKILHLFVLTVARTILRLPLNVPFCMNNSKFNP